MKFYLGVSTVHWLYKSEVPLFMSHRRLRRNKKHYEASCDWALDSGGFSELSMFDTWTISPTDYIDAIKHYEEVIGRLDWAAPQDWMCEPFIIEKTKLSVPIHQERTIDSFIHLSNANLSTHIIPILQGFTLAEYLSHIDMYQKRGIDLTTYPTVGVGSICRRQGTQEAIDILTTLHSIGLNLHGFGLKKQGLKNTHHLLTSADSHSWSYNARRNPKLPECTHPTNCNSCYIYAMKWRQDLLNLLSS